VSKPVDYLRVTEEPLLIHAGFEPGLSETTWWNRDRYGDEWCAIVLPLQTNLRWSRITKSGAMGGYTLMSRERFIHLFRNEDGNEEESGV
jgi:hypothetical protein